MLIWFLRFCMFCIKSKFFPFQLYLLKNLCYYNKVFVYHLHLKDSFRERIQVRIQKIWVKIKTFCQNDIAARAFLYIMKCKALFLFVPRLKHICKKLCHLAELWFLLNINRYSCAINKKLYFTLLVFHAISHRGLPNRRVWGKTNGL